MPIGSFLNGQKFDPETQRIMGLAFELTRAALRLTDQDAFLARRIADRIIALAKAGQSNPELLCDAVLKEYRERRL